LLSVVLAFFLLQCESEINSTTASIMGSLPSRHIYIRNTMPINFDMMNIVDWMCSPETNRPTRSAKFC
jgi:hypothetical protein